MGVNKKEFMTDSLNLKKIANKHSKKLSELGMELGKIKFSYKIENKSSKEYWQNKITNFKKYSEVGLEYYNEAYLLINLVNKVESQIFLLHSSKFRQLGLTLIKIMEKIEKNPSVMNSKDKQQSAWSKEIREEITEHSNKCLHHEKDMNISFREFYEKDLKGILE